MLKERPPMPTEKTSLLLVDDDIAICKLLSLMLAKSGYGVRSTADGFSALAEIRTEIPDILVSDLNMPGMSGFELLSVVRRRFPAIAVIAMSAMYSDATPSPRVAADGFYAKGSTSAGGLL